MDIDIKLIRQDESLIHKSIGYNIKCSTITNYLTLYR